MGLAGRREAMSAPTTGNASESTPVSRAKARPGLCRAGPGSLIDDCHTAEVGNASKRASPMSATHTAQSDQANHEAVRWLILPTPRPCFLVSFVTTITLQDYLLPSTTRHPLEVPTLERQSDERQRVP